MAANKVQNMHTTNSYDWQDWPSGPQTSAVGTPGGLNGGGIILSSLFSAGGYVQRGRHGSINLDQIFNNGMPNGIGIAIALNQFSTGAAALHSGQPVRFRVDSFRGQFGHLDRVAFMCGVVGMYRLSNAAGHKGKPGATATPGVSLNSARFVDTLNEVGTSYNNGLTLLDAAGNNGKAVMWFDARGVANMAINLVSTIKSGVEARFFITGM